MGWKLTVRSGPHVERDRFAELSSALTQLEDRAQELAETAPRRPLDTKLKRFAPGEQVVARLELAGPQRFGASVRVGVDVHGDGSVQAYSGRVRREAILPGPSESPYAALRRTLDV
ncbi:MAG: hypothetical protein M3016_03095 [Actinomycetota bacterium]|nr:hypothetical protein [Actinomycetota bacterium]